MRVVGNYGTSLFNYINQDKDLKQVLSEGVDGSTLSAAARKTLEKNGITIGGGKHTTESKDIYNAVRTSTDALRDSTAKLSGTGKSTLYTDAKESGDTKNIVSEAKTFVSKYNSMITAMKKMGGTTNTEYEKQLSAMIQESKTNLEKIGITSQEDGSFKIDEEKLKKASVDDLKAAFAGDNQLADKVAQKSIYIEANAISAMYDSAVSNYTNSGDYSDLAQSSFLKNI